MRLARGTLAALFAVLPTSAATRPTRPQVTFTKDVAPILFKQCVSCHRPGQVAPFSLLTWQDSARHARLIAETTAAGAMPPWKPVAGFGRFKGERRLTPTDIRTLRLWADQGAPEGNPTVLPPSPSFHDDWQLGPPDLVVSMAKPFAVPPGGEDLYQCFSLPLEFAGDRFVRAIEFRPGNRRVVHHALLFADSGGAARRLSGDHTADGYPCFGLPGFVPSAGLGGWSPGNSVLQYPEGVSIPLRKGSVLVAQIHYHPIGKPESDTSSVGLYFSSTPPKRRIMDAALGSHDIDIPPGDPAYRVTDHFTLPVSVTAVGIIPHAHYVCRKMRGWAILPDGRKQWLLRIDDWDFNWQGQYWYETPIRLPPQTRIEMEFLYDNSDRNPRNPSSPPKRVAWGAGSTDEMAGLHLQVIPDNAADMEELGKSLWGKFMRTVGGGFYRPPPKE